MTVVAEEILLRPIITEKSTTISSELKKYTFEIPRWATKNHVKAAITAAFPKVKVLKINIGKIFGSAKRTKGGIKAPRDRKKAIVTIDGPHIECFPEV